MEHVITVYRRLERRRFWHRVRAGLICNFEFILLKKKREKKNEKEGEKNGMGEGEEELIKKSTYPVKNNKTNFV